MMHMMHTMFTMSVMHIMFRYGIDALLIAVLVSNVLIGRKSRRLVRKLQKYYDDRAPVLINAMEKMASAICPFCVAAAGLAKLRDEEQGEITVEPEMNGEHRLCHGERGYASAPCPAAEIRAEARIVFAETMNVLETAIRAIAKRNGYTVDEESIRRARAFCDRMVDPETGKEAE